MLLSQSLQFAKFACYVHVASYDNVGFQHD